LRQSGAVLLEVYEGNDEGSRPGARQLEFNVVLDADAPVALFVVSYALAGVTLHYLIGLGLPQQLLSLRTSRCQQVGVRVAVP
jgi:hypothetical protein